MANVQDISRRSFLQRTASLTAVGVATPYLIPSTALAGPDKAGANDRIGIGYIGCGRRSGQLRRLPKEGRIVAAADANLPRAQAVAARYEGKAYQDYRKLLESKDVDAVIIASPDHWHALHSIHACRAGKDVYIEKPMTLTIREGRLMVDAARKYKRIVQVGSQQRSMAANRTGCQMVRNGRIGKVKTVYAKNYPSPWECKLPGQPMPKGLDWDMWCGPTEPLPYNIDIYAPRAKPGWISFRPWSGGEMTGWGAHGLDQIQWALGMDHSGPVEVWTEGGKFDPPTYAEPASRSVGEGACSAPIVFFRYANGTVVKLDGGPAGGGTFVGDAGKVIIDRGNCRTEPSDIAKIPAKDSDVQLYVSDNHMGNWFECMKSRELPAADVEIGHRSATVCHLGNIGRWLGRKLQWDPQKEIFPGDEEANALTDRPRRKQYSLPQDV